MKLSTFKMLDISIGHIEKQDADLLQSECDTPRTLPFSVAAYGVVTRNPFLNSFSFTILSYLSRNEFD